MIIPCQQNTALSGQIEKFAEILKTEAHRLGNHGLSESEFYNSGLFRGVIERIRGQFSATMRQKREFVQHILNHMQDHGFIQEWESTGKSNRHDYSVKLNSGQMAIIELKGCLDGIDFPINIQTTFHKKSDIILLHNAYQEVERTI